MVGPAARNLLLVGALGIAWGFNWPAMGLVLAEVPPWTMRAASLWLAAGLLVLVLRLTHRSLAIPRAHWGRVILVGACSVAGFTILSALAQLTATTSRAAVLSYTMPVWAVILARLVLGERLEPSRIVALALGVCGLVALGLPLVLSGAFSIGLVYAVLSGVVWAFGSVVLKRWPIAATPLVVTAWQIALAACIATIGMLVFEGIPRSLPRLPATYLGFAYTVLIGQAFATTLWFTMLGLMSAGTASIGSLVVPGIGVIGAALVLGERPTVADWIGLVLIVAASASVILGPQTAGRPPPGREAA